MDGSERPDTVPTEATGERAQFQHPRRLGCRRCRRRTDGRGEVRLKNGNRREEATEEQEKGEKKRKTRKRRKEESAQADSEIAWWPVLIQWSNRMAELLRENTPETGCQVVSASTHQPKPMLGNLGKPQPSAHDPVRGVFSVAPALPAISHFRAG
ncbi:hypothetical protein GX51_02871 [Blastomyces parvus]|uniref:Uncharacterized protein n=1 Tax=Blastomyces parvus TaxID=2060905 RepID=A0A2B7X9T8_9EURO|nr:hypothetical protein GX51_02871 [Blastomyces parvus]